MSGKVNIDNFLIEKLKKASKIPNYENHLNELFQMNFENKNYNEIAKIIFDKLVFFPIILTDTRPHYLDKLPVYRCRLNIDENIEDIDLIRTYSYPNPCFCNANGRLNVSKKPVFYSSDFQPTTLIETKPKHNDIAYISEWFIHCPRISVYTSILPSVLPKANKWTTKAIKDNEGWRNFIKENVGAKEVETANIAFKFLSDLFLNEKQPYTLSSSIASHFFHTIGMDYIIYPSYADQSHSCNIAFHPNFMDEYGFLNKVYKVKVTDPKENRTLIEILEVGYYYRNKIEWESPTENDYDSLGARKFDK